MNKTEHHEKTPEQARHVRNTVIILVIVALAFYVGFFLMHL